MIPFNSVGRLADALKETDPIITGIPSQPIRRRMGIIVAVRSKGVDVYLGNSGVVLPNLAWLHPYHPVTGDTVWVDINGGDYVVIGKSAPVVGTNGAYQTPTFLNSFANLGGADQTVRYWLDPEGWIHLEGVATRAVTATGVIFNLAAGYRPQRAERFSVVCGPANDICEIDITTNGDVTLGALTGTATTAFIALDGIVFQAAANFQDEAWIPLQSLGTTWGQATVYDDLNIPRCFIRDDGWCRLTGAVASGAFVATPYGISEEARPRYGYMALVANFTGAAAIAGRWDVNPHSLVAVAGNNTLVGLEGVRWWSRLVENAWTVPTLGNSWVRFGNQNCPAGFLIDKYGVVHLRGCIKSGTINAAVFTLPAGYRPLANRRFTALSNNLAARVDVSAAGVVTVVAGSNAFTDLGQVNFRAE